ncbi:MAG: HEAT repeat domain-containing protein [Planctomycetes bacterium]|nr:HEAT repeat domain-containing protein [Planctomycetota bacterium]
MFAFPPDEIRVSPAIARAWERRLVRLMHQDTDQDVREAAAMLLATLVRDEHLAPSARFVAAIRRMIRSEDPRVRSWGCVCAMQLGEYAKPLVPETLALDFGASGKDKAAQAFVFGMFQDFREVDDAAIDWLLAALSDEDPDVRSYAASTLGAVGGDKPRVATALTTRWRDERETKEVRASSLTARSHIRLSEAEARALLQEALPSRAVFDSHTPSVRGATKWAAVVADLAVAANDTMAQRSAIDALRAEFHARPKDFGETALTAAITRVAVALADAALVDAALPDLLSDLEFSMSFGWPTPDVPALELVLAALVDVCRWRTDGQLRITVDDALRSVVEHGYRTERNWARAQRQRLHG